MYISEPPSLSPAHPVKSRLPEPCIQYPHSLPVIFLINRMIEHTLHHTAVHPFPFFFFKSRVFCIQLFRHILGHRFFHFNPLKFCRFYHRRIHFPDPFAAFFLPEPLFPACCPQCSLSEEHKDAYTGCQTYRKQDWQYIIYHSFPDRLFIVGTCRRRRSGYICRRGRRMFHILPLSGLFIIHLTPGMSHLPRELSLILPRTGLIKGRWRYTYPSVYLAVYPQYLYIRVAAVAKWTQKPFRFSRRKYSTKSSPAGVAPGLVS